jgi:chromosome segregation ATPase
VSPAPEAADVLEQRRLAATVRQLRLELARVRGELDEGLGAAGVERAAADVDLEDRVAEAEARAEEAERHARCLAAELATARRAVDLLRARLAALEAAPEEPPPRHPQEVLPSDRRPPRT